MLDMVLSFMRAQEVFVLAGLMLAGWILSQLLASRRYRRLKGGIQSLASLQAPGAAREDGMKEVSARTASAKESYRREEGSHEPAGRSQSVRDELSPGELRRRQVRESLKEELKRDGRGAASAGRTGYEMEQSRPAQTSAAIQPRQMAESRSETAATAVKTTENLSAAGAALPAQEMGNSSYSDGQEEKVDSQLLYLKQSLDRIAASRDGRLADEPKKHRKLTAAEEQIILDILREYLD